MHILLVEDQRKLAENMKAYLETEQYAVSLAHDGKEGFELAMTQEIDLLILDINLPGMDGYLICTMQRQRFLVHQKNPLRVERGREQKRFRALRSFAPL
jgi:DNA-binding response OmpR family regulator